MSGCLLVHAPFRGGKIEHPDGKIFWAKAQRDLEEGKRVRAILLVRVVEGLEATKFSFELTHVTATDEGATFIGTKEGHTIVGGVLYQNQRDGHVLVNWIPPTK